MANEGILGLTCSYSIIDTSVWEKVGEGGGERGRVEGRVWGVEGGAGSKVGRRGG